MFFQAQSLAFQYFPSLSGSQVHVQAQETPTQSSSSAIYWLCDLKAPLSEFHFGIPEPTQHLLLTAAPWDE